MTTLMSRYKTTGNQTLFDAENAAQKISEFVTRPYCIDY